MSGNRMPTKCFTTGQIAKICQVAPRTVSKWFDRGELKGYRIPGSADRRVPRNDLITFLRENNMPDYGLVEEGLLQVVTVGVVGTLLEQLKHLTSVSSLLWIEAADIFQLGLSIQNSVPDIVVLDFSIGRSYCREVVRHILTNKQFRGMAMIAFTSEDEVETHALLTDGFTHICPQPVNPHSVCTLLMEIKRRKHGV